MLAETEMVKDKDTPYLSIVGHVLAGAADDQGEDIGTVALIVYDEYRVW